MKTKHYIHSGALDVVIDFDEWNGDIEKLAKQIFGDNPCIFGGGNSPWLSDEQERARAKMYRELNNARDIWLDYIKQKTGIELPKTNCSNVWSDGLTNTSSTWATTLLGLGYKAKTITSAFYTPKKVIFSKPATIILWADGTKTVVKCQDDDEWDPEKGIAMCFVKKFLGNKGNYYNVIRKTIEMAPEQDEDDPDVESRIFVDPITDSVASSFDDLLDSLCESIKHLEAYCGRKG